jgi:type II secretory pathway pseudopilin PulG
MALRSHTRRRASRRGDDGYILLALLLIVALMMIAAAITLPSITFEIKRDREEELVHRGVQYSRAIRAYYKKFGRYPTKIEDLESSNNLRFLRKRYKDPMTGKDFKLLHYGEVQMTLGGMGGGTIPGANPIGSPTAPNGSAGPGGLGQTSTFGGSTFGNAGSGTTPNSPNQPNGTNQAAGTDASDSPGPGTGTTSPGTTSPGTPGPGNPGSDANNPSGQPLGGGPIVGVVSNAKCPPRPIDECEGFREFNHKKKYKDWQFFYDPGVDRGGLIMTPNQPPLLGMGQGIQGATTPGAPVNGTGSGFSPMGGNQNPPGNSGTNPPTTTAPPTPPGNSPQ